MLLFAMWYMAMRQSDRSRTQITDIEIWDYYSSSLKKKKMKERLGLEWSMHLPFLAKNNSSFHGGRRWNNEKLSTFCSTLCTIQYLMAIIASSVAWDNMHAIRSMLLDLHNQINVSWQLNGHGNGCRPSLRRRTQWSWRWLSVVNKMVTMTRDGYPLGKGTKREKWSSREL